MSKNLRQGHIGLLLFALILPILLGSCGTVSSSGEGVLRVAAEPIVQTDPAFISSDSEVMVANAVYDYLVDVDENNTITPRLAAEWEIRDEGLTYVFTLEEDVLFHDGSPLTAEDVVWTFNRLREPDSGLPTTDLYSNIQSLEATGPLEVTFKLKQTNPFFLFDLSDNHALILKKGTNDAASNFNGTGPFKVTQYTPEDRIELTANEDYFLEGQPRLSALEILFFSDEAAEVDALRSGQVDLITQISTPRFLSLQEEADIHTFSVPTNAFPIVRLRTDQTPGDDPHVIQAIKRAIDREAIFELVQQGYGAIGRDTPVGPLYSDLYTEDIPIPERDLDAARQLLLQAGYAEGLRLELYLPEAQNFPDLAVVLKEQLKEAGIEVDVLVQPESVYYGGDDWMEAGFGITGWGSRPYPQFYLEVMLTCDAIWNESRFCDEEFDRWVEVAGTTLDDGERVDAYYEIQRILIERGSIIIPFFFPQFGAMSEDVEGFQMKAFPGRSDFRPVAVIEQ